MAKQTFTTGQVLTAAQMTSLQQTALGGGSTTAKTASYVLLAADAGTVVQMNSASATTITVNTALFAAGDTVQIQNVGAGVCTVTAGTATVSTSATLALKQYDAGTLYFNTTSAAFFFAVDAADSTSPLTTKGDLYGYSTLDARIPVGTNNQVLTADSAQALGLKWATPAAASVTFSGCSTYKATGQVISGATFTTLLFDTENYDTDAYHSTSSNTGRLTIPAGKTGYYRISLMYALTTDLTIIRLLINGSNVTRGTYSGYIATVIGSGSTPLVWNANMDLSLTAADYVEAQIYSVGGGTTQQQIFSIAYMGA